MNVIPGAELLGYGFNALGEYDTSSAKQQLFDTEYQEGGQYTYHPTNITYQVPDNTSVLDDTETSGNTQVFNTKEQFKSFFSLKAGLKGSYGGFEGEFNAAFSQTLNTDRSYYYCLSESEFKGWQLLLKDVDKNRLSESFLNDPCVTGLPKTYSKENQQEFFAVFRKFGTHYVKQVTVGGKFDYYVAVVKTFSSNEQTIDADLRLEYKAAFVSAQADAKTEWNQLGQNWSESRIVKVDTVGGDSGPLNALDPSFGDSYSSLFNDWGSAVMKNPAVIDFELSSLSDLFPGDIADAVSDALGDYLNGAIVVTANADFTPGKGPGGGNYTTSSSIQVAGKVIIPNPSVPIPAPFTRTMGDGPNKGQKEISAIAGFQIALLSSITLEPIMSHTYYVDRQSVDDYGSAIYPLMMNDIDEVEKQTQDYLAVVAAFSADLRNYPSSDFENWLRSCGASLAEWNIDRGVSMSDNWDICSYVLIGKKGLTTGNGKESFAMLNPYAYMVPVYWGPSLNVSVDVMLYENSDPVTKRNKANLHNV